MKNVTIAALLLTLSTVAFADGPTFNCAKASSKVEKMLCGSELLQRLDVAMSTNYKSMMAASDDLPGGAKGLKQEQKTWVAKQTGV